MNHWTAHVQFDRVPTGDRYVLETKQVTVEKNERNQDRPSLHFNPRYSPGTVISSLIVDGKEMAFETEKNLDTVQLHAQFPIIESSSIIEVHLERTLEIVPPVWNSLVGDANQGLRILSYSVSGLSATLFVEGLAGRAYSIATRQSEPVISVEGAVLSDGNLEVEFPQATNQEFETKTIRFKLKK